MSYTHDTEEHWLRRGTELASDIRIVFQTANVDFRKAIELRKIAVSSCENRRHAFALWCAIYNCLLESVLLGHIDRVKPFHQSDGMEVPYCWVYNGRKFSIIADPPWLTSWKPTHGASYRITEGEFEESNEPIWVNSIEDVLNHIFSTGDVHTLTSPLDVINYNPLEHCDSLPA